MRCRGRQDGEGTSETFAYLESMGRGVEIQERRGWAAKEGPEWSKQFNGHHAADNATTTATTTTVSNARSWAKTKITPEIFEQSVIGLFITHHVICPLPDFRGFTPSEKSVGPNERNNVRRPKILWVADTPDDTMPMWFYDIWWEIPHAKSRRWPPTSTTACL